MNAIISKILEVAKNLGYLALQYAYVCFYWLLRLAKVQLQQWSRFNGKRAVQKAYSGLGAEVYSVYKLGHDSDWARMPAVQQQLKRVEEVESEVFQVDAVVEQINDEFAAKKAELQARFAAKRQSNTSKPGVETGDQPTSADEPMR
jgi:hypothetical protein